MGWDKAREPEIETEMKDWPLEQWKLKPQELIKSERGPERIEPAGKHIFFQAVKDARESAVFKQ